MFKILKLNQIAATGLEVFPKDRYEIASEFSQPDAILVRSATIGADKLPETVRAIARAGAGVNNIPVAVCTERGIPVFNTPGANANAVKELVMAALVLSARGVVQGVNFVNTLGHLTDHAAMSKAVEDGKKQFVGSELAGKTLGIVGLGKIGALVANLGVDLGMQVMGYDPSLSVDAAWQISNLTQRIENLPTLLSRADYISLHVPYNDATKNMIGQNTIKFLKPGAKLLNFSRGEIVECGALIEALNTGKLSRYVTDFPCPHLFGRPDVIMLPHIGASTEEAEETCAIMAARQLVNFLENGNIVNSVNFPALSLEKTSKNRMAIANKNIPKMLGRITSLLADSNINVNEMLNKSRDDVAYNLIDLDTSPSDALLAALRGIEGVINVRVVYAE